MCNPFGNGLDVEIVLCKKRFDPDETIEVYTNLGANLRAIYTLSLSLLIEITIFNPTKDMKMFSIVESVYETKKQKPFIQKEVLMMDLSAVKNHMQ
jgi:hypothetical protein